MQKSKAQKSNGSSFDRGRLSGPNVASGTSAVVNQSLRTLVPVCKFAAVGATIRSAEWIEANISVREAEDHGQHPFLSPGQRRCRRSPGPCPGSRGSSRPLCHQTMSPAKGKPGASNASGTWLGTLLLRAPILQGLVFVFTIARRASSSKLTDLARAVVMAALMPQVAALDRAMKPHGLTWIEGMGISHADFLGANKLVVRSPYYREF
ncbi:hypothetical protein VTN00DRAFT_7286 [Thermoascus crustaceus]|uniref:uncharacterized protein n=1 Tax=Thermoascus crustaceus TaxID=5088 RepID=UPI003742A057